MPAFVKTNVRRLANVLRCPAHIKSQLNTLRSVYRNNSIGNVLGFILDGNQPEASATEIYKGVPSPERPEDSGRLKQWLSSKSFERGALLLASNLPSSQFLDAITSPQMSARLAELKTLSPEIETLYYILGPERFLEWAHSVGVATDAQLRAASAAIPPQTLRSLVAAPSVSVFLWTGLRDAANFLRLYQKHADTKDCVKVLDFGCGCGRMTRFLRAIPWLKVHGTDVNPALAEWCRRNLDRVRTEVNKPIPPLAYSSMEFKLVYSCSIFTHLPELSALQWLGEIQRILAPKGIAILTTHGYMALDIISSSELHQQMFNVTSVAATDIRSRLASEGFIYLRYGDETLSVAKAGNDYGNSFTHENYIRSKWASFGFQVLEYIPGGMRGWQDITVLRKQ